MLTTIQTVISLSHEGMHVSGNVTLYIIHQYKNGNVNLILTTLKVSFSLKQNTKIKSKSKV